MLADKFLLGLCDGNHCAGGQHGRDRGNGRIIVSRMKEDSTRCAWVPEKVISIPATAAFTQYSGIAIRSNRMLIASQVGILAFNCLSDLSDSHTTTLHNFLAAMTRHASHTKENGGPLLVQINSKDQLQGSRGAFVWIAGGLGGVAGRR